MSLIYEQETYKILGACFEVYKQKGSGFTEPVYQECLAIELEIQKIPFVAQPQIQLDYKGRILEQFFKPDFVCFEKLIVEIKALSDLIEANKSQALNYLNATNFELALLINFGHYPKLEHKRIANSRNNCSPKSIRDELKSWS